MNLSAQLTHLDGLQIIRHLDEAELEYMFKHTLTQETVYQSLLKKARRDIHLRVAQTIETLNANRLDENAALLAEHYAQAGDDAKTLDYSTRAGDSAARIYANAEAIAHYTRAIAIARASAEPARIQYLYSRRGRELELASQFPAALENYEEMEQLARERGDRALELCALLAQSQIRCTANSEFNPSLGEPIAQRALQLAHELQDRVAESKILWILLNLYRFTERAAQAREVGEAALKISRELDLREQLAYTLNDLTHVYGFDANFKRARELIEEAMQHWRELGNLPMLADSLATASMYDATVGEFDETIAFSDEAFQISQTIGNLWGQTYSLSTVGVVHWARGDIGRAIGVMEETLRLSDLSGYPVPKMMTRAELGVALASVGAFERGIEHAQAALDFAKAYYPGLRGYTLGAIIQVYAWIGDLAQASAAVTQLQQDESLDNTPLVVYKSYAEMLIASLQGDHPRTLELASRSFDQLRAIGLRSRIPEVLYQRGLAERALGQIDSARNSLLQARVRAQAMGERWQLWQILAARGDLELGCGNRGEAEKLFGEARALIEYIAEHAPPELRESFLNLPRVKQAKESYVEK